VNLKPITEATAKGGRPYQEDRLFKATMQEGVLIAIFDGHGGHETAHWASEEFPGLFVDAIGEPKATPRTAFKNSIHKLAIMTQAQGPGSTLSAVFIPAKGNTITCAVIGDSPIIIKDAKGAINIGPEHNVRTNEAEAQRVRDLGGFVVDGYAYDNRFGYGLQMARALGDSHLARVLSRVPDIYSVKVNKDSFVILASDGVFDPGHYNFHEAANTIVKLVEEGAEAQALVDRAVQIRTGDNATAFVARFEPTKRKKKNANTDHND
jgi:serine/threonine protein phosphatase PrpC